MTLSDKLQAMAAGPAAREPATVDDIQPIEEELGFQLPADYTAFMLRSNGFDIDVDPLIEYRFRLYPINTIIDESYGFDHDVRNEQIVVIGSDGVDNAFAIDFKTDPAHFVKFNHHGSGRSSFIYLGETLEQFVENVLAENTLKKPKGLAKRKKAKRRPDKPDDARKPDDPGLARVLKGHDCESLAPFSYVDERSVFVFKSNQGPHTFDHATGEIKPMPRELTNFHAPVVYDTACNALIGAYFDHHNNQDAFRAFDFNTYEPLGDFQPDPPIRSRSLPEMINFSPDGRRLVIVCGDDNRPDFYAPGIMIFDRESRQQTQRFMSWGGNTSGVTFTPDGLLVHGRKFLDGEKLPCPVYHEIVHRCIDTGEIQKVIRLPDNFFEYFWLRMNAVGRLFAIRQDFVVCEIQDDGSVTQPFGPRRVAEHNSMELVGDDRLLLGTGAGSLHLIDIASGEQVWTARHRRGSCSTLALSTDNKWLLTGVEGPPRLWRLPD